MREIGFAVIKYAFLPSITVAVYVLFVYKRLPNELKRLSWYILLSAFTEIISRMYWLYSQNNMPLLHLYVPGSFFCLALFYQQVLNTFVDKKIIIGMLGAFLIFSFINSFFIQNIYTYDSNGLLIESILVVILSVSTFMVMMDDVVKKKRSGLSRSLNWINSGLFIYYTSSLIIFHFARLLFDDLSYKRFSESFNLQTWMLHAFFLLIMYSCFFVGLWHRPKT
jgi:hypothetical protein